MHINTLGDRRARIVAADVVARMNGRMQSKLPPEELERLAEAIVRSDAHDDLLFRPKPVRHLPPIWSLGGIISRLVLLWQRYREGRVDDERVALSGMKLQFLT